MWTRPRGQRELGRGITQPILHLLAEYCTYLPSKRKPLVRSQTDLLLLLGAKTNLSGPKRQRRQWRHVLQQHVGWDGWPRVWLMNRVGSVCSLRGNLNHTESVKRVFPRFFREWSGATVFCRSVCFSCVAELLTTSFLETGKNVFDGLCSCRRKECYTK